MGRNTFNDIILKSCACKEGNINSTEDILSWIKTCNEETKVSIKKIDLQECEGWDFNHERGSIERKDKKFFSICGIKEQNLENQKVLAQPIMLQQEIGFLGIICKEIDGILNFLMQAKIEPGNVNKVQLSPTVQATKSNFTQAHGGKKTDYIDYFVNIGAADIIVDQLQSEQGSRFFKKRNRNIVVLVKENIEVLTGFMWMTMGQIKELLKYDNLVNMDTRTVISCLPMTSMEEESKEIAYVYNGLNRKKMFNPYSSSFVSLQELDSWMFDGKRIYCKEEGPFDVIFSNIYIENREVKSWCQPLFEAKGIGTFVLFTSVIEGKQKFLTKITHEIGSFDCVELGPTLQREWSDIRASDIDQLDKELFDYFSERVCNKEKVLTDVVLSEEGGRFFCEQNRNVILWVDAKDLMKLPEDYMWLDFATLNLLVQNNNCLNIQLRNLLSLLEV